MCQVKYHVHVRYARNCEHLGTAREFLARSQHSFVCLLSHAYRREEGTSAVASQLMTIWDMVQFDLVRHKSGG